MHAFGVAGVFRTAKASWVGVAGAWRAVKARWVGVNGQWRLKFSGAYPQLVPMTVRAVGAALYTPEASIRFLANGELYAWYWQTSTLVTERLDDWANPSGPGAGAGFELRATVVAGEASYVFGSPLGQWIPGTGDITWALQNNQGGTAKGATLRVQIRVAGMTDPMVEVDVTLSTLALINESAAPGAGGYGPGPGIDRPPTQLF